MGETLKTLYEERLQGLTSTVNSLHEMVGVDEAIRELQGPDMLTYKIDRVNEMVRNVLESEKEHVIMMLLKRCQELESRPKENPSETQASLVYYKKKLEQKERQVEEMGSELNLLRREKQETTKLVQEQQRQFEAYR